jgi:hypothetical protein
VVVWHLIDKPFALRSPAIEAGHVGGGGSLINEDEFLLHVITSDYAAQQGGYPGATWIKSSQEVSRK